MKLNKGLDEVINGLLGKMIDMDKYGLTTFSLKVIAVLSMLIDHIGLFFLRDYEEIYWICRAIGRLSFPLFCFILVEGYFHTKNRMEYAIRLGVFAFISEIPYNLMYGRLIYLEKQNVMFTLFIGFMVIWALDLIIGYAVKYPKIILDKIGMNLMNIILETVVIVLGLAMAGFLETTYSYPGVMLIIAFFVLRKNWLGQVAVNGIFNIAMFDLNVQWVGVFSLLPMALYNGKPGCRKGKYFFYWFYPVHLVVLITIRIILNYTK